MGRNELRDRDGERETSKGSPFDGWRGRRHGQREMKMEKNKCRNREENNF